MSYLQASPGTGGGSGPFTGITGTPTEVAYFDALGQGTSDSLFTRDNTTLETGIYTEFGEYTGGFFTGQPLGPGIGMYGLRAFRSDDTSSGLVALFSADSTNSDVPDGVNEYKSFENQFGSFTQITGGGGYGMEFDSGVTDNQFKESVNETLRSSIYVNTDYTSNSVFQQSTDGATIAWANGPLSNQTQERIVIQSAYTADNSGSVSQQMVGYADIVKSAVGQQIGNIDFTGTGLDDIIITGTYTSSGDTVFTVTVIANDALRLNFSGRMDTDGQFAPGTIVTGSDSGATGEIAVGANNFVFVINTTGTFNTNDILTGDDGNISTVLTSVSGVAQDVVQAVTVNQFGTQSRFMGISMGPIVANDGISLAWGSETVGDHDIGDEWEFTVLRLYAERIIVPAKTFTVPVGTYVDIFELALPAGAMASGFFEWTVNATDGTDFQTRTSRRAWSAVNAGGSITANIGAADTGASVTSGTLVSGFNYNTGTDIVTFNIDATSSLTTTSMEAQVNITNNSKQNITVLY